MQKIRVMTVGLLIVTFTLWDTAVAMRCQGRIVASGQTQAYVRQICGAPTQVKRPKIIFPYTEPDPTYAVWIYNRGTGYLVYQITFSYGRVESVQTVDPADVEPNADF